MTSLSKSPLSKSIWDHDPFKLRSPSRKYRRIEKCIPGREIRGLISMSSGPNQANSLYLLCIRGTLANSSIDPIRTIHNETAGAPQSVAAAQSLGDLSHMVHVPVERTSSGNSEFLILDLWNSMEGLNQFFGNPQVQEQAGRIFSARDPVVWAAAEGFTNYHLPAPFGKNERYVAIARGKVASVDQARSIHNKIVGSQMNKARRAGNMSHQAYFQTSPARIARGIRVSRDGCMDECCGDEQVTAKTKNLSKAFTICLSRSL